MRRTGGTCPLLSHSWPAAGLKDTEIRCFIELEVADGTTEVFTGVQGRSG